MRRDERTIQGVSLALALAGLAIATYIAIAEAGGGAPACVAGSGGCETVSDSAYADLGGVRVAVVGILGYALLAAAALVPGDPGRFAGLLLGLVGLGFTLYLTYLELFEIDAICQWCVASAVVMTLLAGVNLARALRFAGMELDGSPGGEA